MVLTNNVLCFLAGVCHETELSANPRFSPNGMKDVNGVIFRLRMYGGTDLVNSPNVCAILNNAQVGKGTTPANNNDFNIENPFTNGGGAEEDSQQASIPASYVNVTELIEMITTIQAGGSGTITEVCKFAVCNDGDTGVDRICLISRDIISPVAFIANDVINIIHKVST